MLFLQISIAIISVILALMAYRYVQIYTSLKDLKNFVKEQFTSESSNDNSCKYYAVCVCQKSNKQRSYFSFVTDDYVDGDLSCTDIANLRENVLRANPEFTSCEILFFSKIKD